MVPARSPPATVALSHGDSVRLLETTTFGVLFMKSIACWGSPGGPACHAGMKPSASLRPSTIRSTFDVIALMYAPTSSVHGNCIQSISPLGPAM
jgi:hypothetical protein